MAFVTWDVWQWLALVQQELLLFAGIFFLIGALDDILIDAIWLWLKVTGQAKTQIVSREDLQERELAGPIAIFIPAWKESAVIGDTILHALHVWPQADLRIYVGCYQNDAATIEAAMKAVAQIGRSDGPTGHDRLRIVIHDRPGPSTKADCLNRLHQALRDDERRSGQLFSGVVFHDAEDLVDPGALGLLDAALADGADFVQLPVEPLPQRKSRWLGSHYCEEFAESHGKTMVVRQSLGAAIPAAGVGCAISRRALHTLSRRRIDGSPFDEESLTEDYELGLAIGAMGGTSRFIRAYGEDGKLIATRAYFPSRLRDVVRQKTRWVHGIALQGWDRMGWRGGLIETWMRGRDRRGPLTALVLFAGYALLILTAILWLGIAAGVAEPLPWSATLNFLLVTNLAAFAWRALWRFAFTSSVYGVGEGIRAILRFPLANVVSIISGRRAVTAYAATLMGRAIKWDKTPHSDHPARHEWLGDKTNRMRLPRPESGQA